MSVRAKLAPYARTALDGLEHLVGGLGTAILAMAIFFGLLVTAMLCALGIGLLFAPYALRALRVLADRERARLSRWGPDILGAEPVPATLKEAVRNRTVHRELLWVLVHSTMGFLLGVLGLALPLNAVRDGLFPLYWQLFPAGEATSSVGFPTADSFVSALPVSLMGVGWAILTLTIPLAMARLQGWPGRKLLAPDGDVDLALRVAQLTATRAAALDAHAVELRRIERSLHDGAQNRLVAVNVLVGAARRALKRNPDDAEAILDRVQNATEEALAELRAVVRSILPPVLTDRSLTDALTTLASNCPVPCRIDADVPGRCAASVEATAYFVVAEALTNVAKHSRATNAAVTIRRQGEQLWFQVTDDGRGGADDRAGTGLDGIRRRVEAVDGSFTLDSPTGGPTTMTVSLPCGS